MGNGHLWEEVGDKEDAIRLQAWLRSDKILGSDPIRSRKFLWKIYVERHFPPLCHIQVKPMAFSNALSSRHNDGEEDLPRVRVFFLLGI